MKRDRRSLVKRAGARAAIVIGALAVVGGLARLAVGCGWDPSKPFDRDVPEVDQALAALDAGQLEGAASLLEGYLGTGACAETGFGVPDKVGASPHASFDLGLVLFAIGEKFGSRFGEEGAPGSEQDPAAEDLATKRGVQIDCALLITRAIASDPKVPIELRARAYYLAGNLDFLRAKYEDAVTSYDLALGLIPGVPDDAGVDGIGRDAAWNRAIALRRLEEQDAGPDAEPPDAEPPDGGDDGGDDGGGDAGDDGGDNADGGDQGDAGSDAGSDSGSNDDDGGAEPPPANPDEAEPPPLDVSQDDRQLDRLEEAPTYQEQEAKARAGLRRGRTMEDK